MVASANGGLPGLLTVGEDFPIRDFVTAELGTVELAAGDGHDGQQYFGIARDPLGTGVVPDLVDNASYRYLHILYPALAGGFGFFSATTTVALMFVLAVAGFGLAAGMALALAGRLGGRSPVAVLAVANLGLLLAVRFLLPDALALGLSMLGIWWTVAGRDRPAAAALALSVLTKPTYAIVPAMLGVWAWRTDRTRLPMLAAAPLAPGAAWALYVFVRFGISTSGNLGLPFAGLIGAPGLWDDVSTGEVTFALAAVVVLAVAGLLARATAVPILRWLLVGWVAIGLLSSSLVWEFGNNALRVLAPLWTIGAVAAAVYFSSSMSRRNLPV